MRISFASALLSLFLGISSVHAEGNISYPATLPRGMVLEWSSTLTLRRGDVSTPLSRVGLFGASLNEQGTVLELVPDTCSYSGEPLVTTFTLNMLEARLENAAALKLHRAHRYAEAAQGFRKALKLDPVYNLAAYNLASSLSRAAKPDEAVAALAPFLKRELPKTYLAILKDPELLPLLETPALRQLQAVPPGAGLLTEPEPGWQAYSAKHGLLAALDQHRGLVIFSLRSGELLAQLAMGSVEVRISCGDHYEDCQRAIDKERRQATVAAKAEFMRQRPLANSLLSALGFAAIGQREPGKPCDRACTANCLYCFRSGLSVKLNDDELKVYQAGKAPKNDDPHDPSWQRLEGATYLPGLKALVYQWTKNGGSQECGSLGGTELKLISAKDK